VLGARDEPGPFAPIALLRLHGGVVLDRGLNRERDVDSRGEDERGKEGPGDRADEP
jgi:hypothetical protein